MNKKQRLVLAIFIPIIVFFITLMIANSMGVTLIIHMRGVSFEGGEVKFTGGPISSYDTYAHNPFDWEKTWYVWLLFLVFCCIFEYKLFGDKKR